METTKIRRNWTEIKDLQEATKYGVLKTHFFATKAPRHQDSLSFFKGLCTYLVPCCLRGNSRMTVPGIILSCLLLGISICQAQSFREISREIGINSFCLDPNLMGGGVAFFDFNQDNYPDIFIIGGKNPNRLFRNNWDGTFSEISQLAGVALPEINTVGAAIGDIDNDGDDDLFVTTGSDHPNILLQNNGDETFSDISENAGIVDRAWSTSATFGDFNLDGLLDIYVSNYAPSDEYPFEQHLSGCTPNFLYLNMGNNQFENVAESLAVADRGCGLAVTFTDCDNDQDLDLFVANDFGNRFEPNELYLNTFPETRFEATASVANLDVGINAMGIAIGDYDEDGDFDYYVTNMGDNPFFENIDHGMYFQDMAAPKGVANPDGTSWGAAFLDYNNDTYLDLVVANGKVVEASHQNNENRLFKGNEDYVFEDVSKTVGIADPKGCRGLSIADLDLDGDLDFMFGVVSADPQTEDYALVYKNNESNQNHWLKVKLEGTNSNRNGYGSHLQIFIGDRSLIREVDGGSSYLSHHFNETHFGLGTFGYIDSLIVTWPGGNQDVIQYISTNTSITVVENSHWCTNQNETITITAGDSILLGNTFQTREGIYRHSILDRNGLDSILITTKLQVQDTLNIKPIIELTASPNPFRSSTLLNYKLLEDSQVQISVFDLTGRCLSTLVNKNQLAGNHFFSLEDGNLGQESGLFIVKLFIDNQVYSLKVARF